MRYVCLDKKSTKISRICSMFSVIYTWEIAESLGHTNYRPRATAADKTTDTRNGKIFKQLHHVKNILKNYNFLSEKYY